MYFPLALILAVTAFSVARNLSPRHAIWFVWWPALLIPTYSVLYVGGIEITLATVAGGALLAASFGITSGHRTPWILSDYLMLGFISSGIISEFSTGGGITDCLDVARRWGIPYLLGRMALSSFPGNKSRIPSSAMLGMTLMCLAAGGLAIFEAVTHMNPYWAFSGHEWEYLVRYGLRRASGPAEHSITFGMFLVGLLPWAIEAARRSLWRLGPAWWQWLPYVIGAGLVCTVSRGAWLAGLVAVGLLVYLRRPAYRSAMLSTAVIGIVLVWFTWTDLVAGVNALTGRDSTSTKSTITIDGEKYTYTGTNHRYLQFLVYRVQLEQAGLFGYGYKGLERFGRGLRREEYVPGLPTNIPRSFGSIDSHYLLTMLLRGWLGMGLWLALSVVSIVYLASTPANEDQLLGHALAGSILGMMVGMLSVYSDKPFEEVFVFMLGLAAAWKSQSVIRGPYERSLVEPSRRDASLPSPSHLHGQTQVACAIDTK